MIREKKKRIILNFCLECPCAVNDKCHAECKTGKGGKLETALAH